MQSHVAQPPRLCGPRPVGVPHLPASRKTRNSLTRIIRDPRRRGAGGCRQTEEESGSVGGPGKRFAVTERCTEGEQRGVLPVAVQHTGCGYNISPRPS